MDNSQNYARVYRRSLEEPAAFWSEAAADIHWDRPWDQVLKDDEAPFYKWFAGGQLNTCFNAVDRHVQAGFGDRTALIYDSAMTDTVRRISYAELQDLTARMAGALRARGVNRGDRVIIYMPMVPEAVIAMLACARLGAIHSVVFGGFAADQLAVRIRDADPALVVTASCGLEPGRVVEYLPLLNRAREIAGRPQLPALVLQRPEHVAELIPDRDEDLEAAVAGSDPAPCVPVAATDPLYILYTSGTTGLPKGVVRDNGGHAVALNWTMKNIYGMQPGDVFWAASDVGWVVGHSYIVYAPLLAGCTSILYEGKPVGTPDAGSFWRVIRDHGVNALFTAPTAIRAIKREDPDTRLLDSYQTDTLRTLFLAGERCDVDTLHWAERQLGVPVIDHWWQTETGWPIVCNPMGIEALPVKPGSPSVSMPGYDVRVLDDQGQEVPDEETGNIVIRLPMPPGCLPTLWRDDARYTRSYLSRFPGFYLTGDAGIRDSDGYLWIMSRIDDVINVAGHRLSTGSLEEAVASHPAVAECAVVGVHDELKGQVPIALLVTKQGSGLAAEDLRGEVIALVRDRIGPVASMKRALVVDRLPKTRSGKVLRAVIRRIADGQPFDMPATIEDPAVLDELKRVLAPKAQT